MGCTGKSCQNSQGTGIAIFAGGTGRPVQWTATTGVAPSILATVAVAIHTAMGLILLKSILL